MTTTDNITYRIMTEQDIAPVLVIERACHGFPWTEGILQDCLKVGYLCPLVILDGVIVGYGILSIAAGEAHILNLCVDPFRQGRGIGKRLLKKLLGLARRGGAARIFLEVRASNGIALKMYQDLGFAGIGRRKRYYPAPDNRREDALVLEKTYRR